MKYTTVGRGMKYRTIQEAIDDCPGRVDNSVHIRLYERSKKIPRVRTWIKHKLIMLGVLKPEIYGGYTETVDCQTGFINTPFSGYYELIDNETAAWMTAMGHYRPKRKLV